jgi:hypothetical protein
LRIGEHTAGSFEFNPERLSGDSDNKIRRPNSRSGTLIGPVPVERQRAPDKFPTENALFIAFKPLFGLSNGSVTSDARFAQARPVPRTHAL